jgi:hypothetical protein
MLARFRHQEKRSLEADEQVLLFYKATNFREFEMRLSV